MKNINSDLYEKKETRYRERCSVCGKEKIVYTYTHKLTGQSQSFAEECECEKAIRLEEEEKQRKIKRIEFAEKCNKLFPFLLCDPDIKEHTFSNFEVQPGTEQAFNEAKKVTFSYWGKYGVNLIGEYGNGKTRLLKTIGYESHSRGKIVIFIEYARIFDRIFATQDKGSNESKKDLLDCLINCDELLVDDLGIGNNSAAKEDLFLLILNERRRKGKRVHFSMNEKDAELNLSGRVRSRLLEFARPVINNGKDYRPTMLKKKLAAEKKSAAEEVHA